LPPGRFDRSSFGGSVPLISIGRPNHEGSGDHRNSPRRCADLLSGGGPLAALLHDMGHGTTSARSDDALIGASCRGDREAFGELVERYLDVVCAVGFSATGSRAVAEDVAQDTFLAAWVQLGTLREPSRLRAWLCGIARNLARKARARAAREAATELAAESSLGVTGPLDRLTAIEEQRLVWGALAQVPAAYREVLVLYYQHERSIAEVAAQLGIREDAATQRLSRGRKHLAGQLHATVERALDGARPSSAVGRKIVAALPPLAFASLAGTRDANAAGSPGSMSSNSATTGTSMLKIALATVFGVAAAGAAITYVATRPSDAAPTTSASQAATASPPTAAASARAIPLAAQPDRAGGAKPAASPPPPAQAAGGCDPCEAQIDDDAPALDADDIAAHRLHVGPSRGPADAPVQIAVFEDLECVYCAKVLGTIDQLWEDYPGKLRLIVKQFPLPVHSHARLGAEASLAAHAQGKFWVFHDLVIANQEDLSRDLLVELAGQAGLDVATFTLALDDHTFASAVQRDISDGVAVGVDAIPVFFINGRRFTGAQPLDQFRAAIDAALAAP
jgi:RNA polymerase sigma factor (sigma-70 family)